MVLVNNLSMSPLTRRWKEEHSIGSDASLLVEVQGPAEFHIGYPPLTSDQG